MSEIPEDIVATVSNLVMAWGSDPKKDDLGLSIAIEEAILAERDQAKQTGNAALRFVEKALNDISDSEEDAIDSLERARLELIEIVEA